MVPYGLLMEGDPVILELALRTPAPVPLFAGCRQEPVGTVSDFKLSRNPDGSLVILAAFNGLNPADFPDYYGCSVELWHDNGHIRQVRLEPKIEPVDPVVTFRGR